MYELRTSVAYEPIVYQAQGMIAVQADCILERALALMIDTADAADVTLDQLAAQVVDRTVRFDNPT